MTPRASTLPASIGPTLGALAVLVLAPLAACGSGGGADDDDDAADASTEPPEPSTDWSRDILSTALTVDVSAMRGTAVIELAGSTDSTGASFEVGDLTIDAITSGGASLQFAREGERLDVGVPAGADPVSLTVEYTYAIHDQFEGVMSSGLTLTWPYYCGNIFPCKSDPADGLTFSLELTGVPGDATAVYPEAIPGDAPSYMIAWAIDDYEYLDLGTTAAGTQVGVWHIAGQDIDATEGTVNLRGVVDWLETELGAYIFGDEVASVSAAWGFGAFGGMEHHPLWHVASGAMTSQEVHAHEAAHGWFGNGIRIACWEDFVLSEGVVTYLAARILGEVGDATLEEDIWSSYGRRLTTLQSGTGNKIAWPEGCNELDILDDGLFGDAPYMKGAHFFRDVAAVIGVDTLDAALQAFYLDNAGKAARFGDLLDTIEATSGWDPRPCATAWLRADELPPAGACQE